MRHCTKFVSVRTNYFVIEFTERAAQTARALDIEVQVPDSPMSLAGRVALVVGAGKGLGRALVAGLAEAGADVAVIARTRRDVDDAAAEIGALGRRAVAICADATQSAEIDRAIDSVVDAFGGIDVLVNAVGGNLRKALLDTSDTEWDAAVRSNLTSTFYACRAVGRHMLPRKRGNVINIASTAGTRGRPNMASYCATKAAVISLTQSAGLALIRHGINVNAIAPGVVDGEHWDGVDALFARYENRPLGEKKRLVGEAVPAGRMGTAEDLTGMAVFLASADSDYVVAQTYNVDGGNWMS